MNIILKVLPLFLLLFMGCNRDEQNLEISDELQEIIDNGVTVDLVGIDYAAIYTSDDGFPVIEPNPIDNFVDKDEAIIYFEFVSHSRDALYEYYAKVSEVNDRKGIVVDWITKYFDKLEDIAVEVKKNDSEFYEVNGDTAVMKFIPTPEINSGFTFAKYEMTKEEFISRYDESFPESFIFWFDDNNLKSNTYVFKITFKLNNNKEFVLQSEEMKF